MPYPLGHRGILRAKHIELIEENNAGDTNRNNRRADRGIERFGVIQHTNFRNTALL